MSDMYATSSPRMHEEQECKCKGIHDSFVIRAYPDSKSKYFMDSSDIEADYGINFWYFLNEAYG